MKRYLYILLYALMVMGCLEDGFDHEPVENNPGIISPSIRHMWTMEMPTTRSLVDNLTTRAMEANFLRLDEDVDDAGNGLYTYTADAPEYNGKINWEKAKIVEGSVISSPDRYGRRSVYLNPVQGYPLSAKTIGDEKITTYYHTRLVSWFPRTCELIKDPETGMATDYIFDMYNSSMTGSGSSRYEADDKGNVKIRFTGLNGETDVMVSDVVEAQHYHKDGETDVICNGHHRDPLGHSDANPSYESLMQYKHYMSAVRVNAYPTDRSAQTIALWGEIKKVVVVDQPTECLVTLPSSIDDQTGRSGYGEVEFSEDKLSNFEIIRTPMFGNDANNDDNYTADEVSTLQDYSASNPMKLGYALIAPERNLKLDIHTDAGVYRVDIPADNVFKSGKIYDLYLEFQTSNTIAALILSDAGYDYFDLTAGKMYDPMYGEGLYDYKHSNCYVIHPEIAGDDVVVDGFCFDATVVGNGDEGVLPGFDRTTAAIEPVSAGLIWESSYGLIQQVELLYGYVRFRVPGYESQSFGNAVIGVFDARGNTLWSWHIWVTDSNPTSITYSLGSAEIGVMDRNLGALTSIPTDAETALKAYGLYYQWGRKDPSMWAPTYDYRPMSTATADYYDGFGATQQSTGVMNIPHPAIEDGIANPMYLILPTEWSSFYQFDWLYNRVDNLWGNDNGLRKKTIYDPCPEGYWVPGDHLNMLFQDAKANSRFSTANIYAMRVENGEKDLYFPYAGYKGVDRGMSSLVSTWKYVGQKGDYMSALIMNDRSRGRSYLSKSSDGWNEIGTDGQSEVHYEGGHFSMNAGGANRRTAATVRCVTAQPFGSIQIGLEMDKDMYSESDVVSGSFDYAVQGNLFYNMTYNVEYGFSQNQNTPEGVQTWYRGEDLYINKDTKTFQWTLANGTPLANSYMWIRMTIHLVDMDIDVYEYALCVFVSGNYMSIDISSFSGGRVEGKYSALSKSSDDASVAIQYILSDGFVEPTEDDWENATEVQAVLGYDSSYSFNVSPEYLTDLWVRVKMTMNNGDKGFSDASTVMVYPSFDTHTASDIQTNPYKYYILTVKNRRLTKFLSSNGNNDGVVISDMTKVYTENSKHIFKIENYQQLQQLSGRDGFSDGSTFYWNIGTGFLKHASSGKYLTSGTGLSSNAATFQFSSNWNNGGGNSAVDIIYNDNVYLYTNNDYQRLWIDTNWRGYPYEWQLFPVLPPK